jgi:exosortase A-associated hydrolase 1
VSFAERALVFGCGGEQLIGILAKPASPRKVGVLIVVGGPQYRVGSHRQFVLLARRLAAEAVAVMRFDYRGMGDSTGPSRSFDEIAPDIAAAIDGLCSACPEVEQVVLWGLCDAASAALTYWHATRDTRVAGMVLLNPWVRSEASIAATRLKHYYGQHLLEREFWTRFFRGRVDVVRAVRDFAGSLRAGGTKRSGNAAENASTFQDRMAAGLSTFAGPVLVILSGRDLTAKEFLAYAQSSPRWSGLLDRPNLVRHEVRDADHTFSSAQWRGEVEAQTLDWLRQSFSSAPR